MRSKLRTAALVVAAAVSAGTAGVVVGWQANQPEPIRFCTTSMKIVEPGREVEVEGILAALVEHTDPELGEQRRGCNHYEAQLLVTPDCRVHYDNDWEGPRIKQLDKALANGWCG